MEKIWNEEKDEILKKFYHENGAEYCSKICKSTRRQAQNRANRLGITITKDLRSSIMRENCVNAWNLKKPERFNVNYTYFTENFIKESCYLLGFIWADGYLSDKHSHKIIVENLREDLESIEKTFNAVGKWTKTYRKRGDRREQARFETSNFVIFDFLVKNDYKKNGASPKKILKLIPEELIKYWFRGYFDGDGCFYLNLKNHCYQTSLSSVYEQDWDFLFDYFGDLNFKIQKIIRKNGNRHSSIRITNRRDIIKFGDFLYDDFFDGIGLFRKYKKFMEIKSSPVLKKLLNI